MSESGTSRTRPDGPDVAGLVAAIKAGLLAPQDLAAIGQAIDDAADTVRPELP